MLSLGFKGAKLLESLYEDFRFLDALLPLRVRRSSVYNRYPLGLLAFLNLSALEIRLALKVGILLLNII